MQVVRSFFLTLMLAALAAGQQPAGVAAEWDTRQALATLAEQARQLRPLLAKVEPSRWMREGASPAYVSQWQSLRDAVDHLVRSSEQLAQRPERMPAALDTLFRLQSLEGSLSSLIGGVRRYQNPDLANDLARLLGAQAANKDRLRQYVMDLAATQETERDVMDREAQRCRSQQIAIPPARRERRPGQP